MSLIFRRVTWITSNNFIPRKSTMKQTTNEAKPYFLSDDARPSPLLPCFVTRTNLRQILKKYGIETLQDLGSDPKKKSHNKPDLSEPNL